jgi:hypothetical protein
MDHEVNSFLSWMFAWLGVPLLFSVVATLTYLVVRHEPPSGHPADSVCIGITLVFVAVGTSWVRERLRPRRAWVAPAYAGTMLILLFIVLAFTSLQYTGDL